MLFNTVGFVRIGANPDSIDLIDITDLGFARLQLDFLLRSHLWNALSIVSCPHIICVTVIAIPPSLASRFSTLAKLLLFEF